MRIGVEVCFGIRNIGCVGLVLAPAARFTREAAERRKHLAADIVVWPRNDHRGFCWVGFFYFFFFDFFLFLRVGNTGLWAWVVLLGLYGPIIRHNPFYLYFFLFFILWIQLNFDQFYKNKLRQFNRLNCELALSMSYSGNRFPVETASMQIQHQSFNFN
jgi:hypothetical protein